MYHQLFQNACVGVVIALFYATGLPLDEEVDHIHKTQATLLRHGQLTIETFPPLSYLFASPVVGEYWKLIRTGSLCAATLGVMACTQHVFPYGISGSRWSPVRKVLVLCFAIAWLQFRAGDTASVTSLGMAEEAASSLLALVVCLCFWSLGSGRSLRQRGAAVAIDLLLPIVALTGIDTAGMLAVCLGMKALDMQRAFTLLADRSTSVLSILSSLSFRLSRSIFVLVFLTAIVCSYTYPTSEVATGGNYNLRFLGAATRRSLRPSQPTSFGKEKLSPDHVQSTQVGLPDMPFSLYLPKAGFLWSDDLSWDDKQGVFDDLGDVLVSNGVDRSHESLNSGEQQRRVIYQDRINKISPWVFERVLVEEVGYTPDSSRSYPIHDNEPVRIRNLGNGGYLSTRGAQSIIDEELGLVFDNSTEHVRYRVSVTSQAHDWAIWVIHYDQTLGEGGLQIYHPATGCFLSTSYPHQPKRSYVAIPCSDYGGDTGQGTGSLSVIDSNFDSVAYAIPIKLGGPDPNIVLDNVRMNGVSQGVFYDGTAQDLLDVPGNAVVKSWATGRRYTTINGTGDSMTGNVNPAPSKPAALLSPNGTYYARSKPQYELISSVVNVLDRGILNDGTGDQAAAINTLLSSSIGSVIFFPAGVYVVKSTVTIPKGSIVVGAGWSQIMASGSYFQNEKAPKVVVKVGNAGDQGSVELSDLLFTVQGPTAGAVLMEWNIHESTQGSAAMWDCHFRVGGAKGSNLQLADCPTGSVNPKCYAASMLLHLTKTSSGYFENIWAWTADHDLDAGGCDGNTTTCSQISVFSGRGILVESQGPSWFYGTASEHNVLYQYQLSGAKSIYLGHMQTETPYFQPNPDATKPFTIGNFASDPEFSDCVGNSSCTESWALRIINSTNAYIYSAGFYSFFSDYDLACSQGGSEKCQSHIFETAYSQGLWIYNLFTKGTVEVASPQGPIEPLYQEDNQDQFTTEVSVWISLALAGGNLGGHGDDSKTPDNVSIVPLPCTTVPAKATFTMSQACTSGILVLPATGPDASRNNNPPGPVVCHERCDFWRRITGSCCGVGGSVGNPIVIPPGVTLPYDILLLPGYTPGFNITVPVPGQYDPECVFGTKCTTATTSYPPGEIYTTVTTVIPTTSGGQVSSRTVTTCSPLHSHTTVITAITGGKTSTITSKATDSSASATPPQGTDSSGKPCKVGTCGCIPSGTPLQIPSAGAAFVSQVVLPGGYCDSTHPIGIPPPVKLPDDPPCFGSHCRPCTSGVCGDTKQSDGGEDDGDNPDEGDTCKQELSLNTGLCPNGNFPLYNPSTSSIDCDFNAETSLDVVPSCQRRALDDPSSVEDAADHNDECECGGAGLSRRSAELEAAILGSKQDGSINQTIWHEYRAKLEHLHDRRANARCPSTTLDPPQQVGQCHATYTCNFDRFPNVCANARSAINERGKTSVLTYNYADADYHDTSAWERGKYVPGSSESIAQAIRAGGQGSRDGWGLVDCQIEEYPWNPRANVLSDHAVNRLIPRKENGAHGSDWNNFLQSQDPTGNGKSYNVHGLTICMKFGGSTFSSGRTENGYLLGPDQTRNVCGQAYGPGFLLANAVDRSTDPNNWDPWWNNHLVQHAVSVNRQGVTQYASLPSQYCQYRSPSMKTWDSARHVWATQVNGVVFGTGKTRRGGNRYLRCDDPVVYTGPMGTTGPSKRDEILAEDFDSAANLTSRVFPTSLDLGTGPSLPIDKALLARAATGSYLDARLYEVLGCDNVDFDPCEWSEDCTDRDYPPPPADGYDGPTSIVSGGSGTTLTSARPPTNPTSATTPIVSGGSGTTLTSVRPPTHPTSATTPTSASVRPPTTPATSSTITNPPAAPSYISCSHQDQDPGLGIFTPYCVCSGSTFQESVNTASTPYNSCAYTAKPTSTLAITITNPTPTPPTPTPTPSPSGSLCFATFYVAAVEDEEPRTEFIAFKPGNACSNDQSTVLGQYDVVDECSLARDMTQFSVCGTLANFVNVGPTVINDSECQTGFELSINGKNYAGDRPDSDNDPCQQSCTSFGAFGTSYGEVIFHNVPICS